MALEIIPRFDPEGTAFGDSPQGTLPYVVTGSEDEVEVKALVESTIPAFWLGLPFRDYRFKHIGGGVWDIAAEYARLAPRKLGDRVVNFDTSGGTTKIFQSLENIANYMVRPVGVLAITVTDGGAGYVAGLTTATITGGGGSGATVSGDDILIVDTEIVAVTVSNPGAGYTSPPTITFIGGDGAVAECEIGEYGPTDGPDFGGAINVTTDNVEGCDIVAPQFRWSETHYLPLAYVGDDYLRTLMTLTGTVNMNPFRGFEAGEVLFLGSKGGQRNQEDVEITFDFAGSENKTVTVGTVTDIAKGGWEYLWVRYKTATDSTAQAMTKKVSSVHVERVYESKDFADLGIGS